MSSTAEIKRAVTAALRRLEAGGPANVEEARRLLREALGIPEDSKTDALAWRALLVRYMAHVIREESIAYIPFKFDGFSPEEIALLSGIEAEARGEDKS